MLFEFLHDKCAFTNLLASDLENKDVESLKYFELYVVVLARNYLWMKMNKGGRHQNMCSGAYPCAALEHAVFYKPITRAHGLIFNYFKKINK